jgi:RimJ/RimL family protein N-acetyltransferase
MDSYDDVLEVQRGEYGSVDLRVSSEQPIPLSDDDLSLLKLTDVEQVQELIELYEEVDIPREHVTLFKQHLLQRTDSWFVQVADVGLIYLTNIVPSFTANLQVIFWDRRFGKNRRELVQHVLATAFDEFDLTRVQALVPESNAPLAKTELRKIGFTQEGVMRKAWRDEVDIDLVLFGLLRNEAVWQSVPHLKTATTSGERHSSE